MATYYELLKIQPTASPAEINTAIEDQYNQWRRLVTHHDPNVVTQANQTLQLLETIRSTLMDTSKRSVYDAAIGINGQQIGGLGDPDALLRLGGAVATPPQPATRANASPARVVEATNVWVCSKCNTVNPLKTKFCSKCGLQLGVDCPNCGKLTKATDKFCAECGKNLEESKVKADENLQVLQWINQTRTSAGRMKHMPTIRSLIGRGTFPEIYKVCFDVMSSIKIKSMGLSFSVKNVTTNPQIGEINGEIANFASFPKKFSLKLFVQKTSFPVLGVVLVVTTNYPQVDLGTGLSFVANPFMQSLLERPDLFSDINS